MYVLIPKTKLKGAGRVTFHNTMPDGRAIVHIGEMKAIGSVTGVDIITTKRELTELMDYQKENGIFPEEPQFNPDEPVQDGSVPIPTPDGNSGSDTVDTPTVLPELDPDLLPPTTSTSPDTTEGTDSTDSTTATDKEQTAEQLQPTGTAEKGGKA